MHAARVRTRRFPVSDEHRAVDGASRRRAAPGAPRMTDSRRLEQIGFWLLAACLAVVQIKIAPAQILFGLAAIVWLTIAVSERRFDVPRFFWPLALYGVLTL